MRTTIACLLLAAANAGTSPEGKTWLEAKAKEDGVVTLESGLMYKVLRDGDGENHPKASTSCECHYEGKLIDGTVFEDNSFMNTYANTNSTLSLSNASLTGSLYGVYSNEGTVSITDTEVIDGYNHGLYLFSNDPVVIEAKLRDAAGWLLHSSAIE